MSDVEQRHRKHRQYQQIERAIHYLIEHQSEQPGLNELSDHLGLSESHLQRMFTDWAGVSPKQFLQYLTKEHAKRKLREQPVLASALDVGLSSGSRLHDLLITCEHVTPGEVRSLGKDLQIEYGSHDSPFGPCFLAQTTRGLCKLAFFDHVDEREHLLQELKQDWANACIEENTSATRVSLEQIFPAQTDMPAPLKLLLKGSAFQLQVWEALLKIPSGQLHSYQHIAEAIGQPSATRAAASAIARNNIAWLIPCHRVIRSTGIINQYRWGATRKAAMIGWEMAKTEARADAQPVQPAPEMK